jgi:hypothetical protein
MSLKLNSSGGGSVLLQEPTTASNRTISLPDGTGTVAVQGVSSNIVSGAAVASTSGTSIDFTGIPSWVKRITVMFSGVSTNGTSVVQVQLGTSSGIESSGYAGETWQANTNNSGLGAGFAMGVSNAAANGAYGAVTLLLISNNVWVASGTFGRTNFIDSVIINGSKSLSGTLDRVRVTTVNGTDTFDAGTINILYE